MNLADQRQIDGTGWIDPERLVRDFFHAEYPNPHLVVRPKHVLRLFFALGWGGGSWNRLARRQEACCQQDETEMLCFRDTVHLNVAGDCSRKISSCSARF